MGEKDYPGISWKTKFWRSGRKKNWINYFNYAFDPEEKGLLFIGELHLGKNSDQAAAGSGKRKATRHMRYMAKIFPKTKRTQRTDRNYL